MKSVQLKNSLLALGMLVACLIVCPQVMAQDAEITDEELTQYAQVSAKIDSLKAGMKAKISEEVKSNELMEGGKLYNKLNKARGDEAKLAEIGASEEQLAAYEEIQANITGYKADFKTQYTAVVKDEIGAGVFNKVKKALKSNPELKTKYDEIVASMSSEEEEAEGEE